MQPRNYEGLQLPASQGFDIRSHRCRTRMIQLLSGIHGRETHLINYIIFCDNRFITDVLGESSAPVSRRARGFLIAMHLEDEIYEQILQSWTMNLFFGAH